MWKSKKWEEEVTHWKVSLMILSLALIAIAFTAGKNSNYNITGQITSNINSIGVIIMIAFTIGLFVGRRWFK
jgi:hypothetical protein